MRKLGFLFLIFAVIIFSAIFYRLRFDTSPSSSKNHIQEVVDESISSSESYIFVPHWTIDADVENTPFDTLIYFGIQGTTQGISTSEEGYKNIEKFIAVSGKKKKLLTVRMLDSEENSDILKDKNIQKKIILESISLAKSNKFSGIVLDLEMKGLPFDTLVNRITEFNREFSKEAKLNNLSFNTLIYADVYHRIRPYDVKAISENVDKVFVMSYDFSKSGGNPGPNFPLGGASTFGYDFKTMVADFKEEVPLSKLTFVFGMFGYEWPVDESGKSKDRASAKTTLQMERMMTRCVSEKSCNVVLDSLSQETKIEYELDGEKYISWFETAKSTEEKIKYLKEKGLHSIGWWAYSYF